MTDEQVYRPTEKILKIKTTTTEYLENIRKLEEFERRVWDWERGNNPGKRDLQLFITSVPINTCFNLLQRNRINEFRLT